MLSFLFSCCGEAKKCHAYEMLFYAPFFFFSFFSSFLQVVCARCYGDARLGGKE